MCSLAYKLGQSLQPFASTSIFHLVGGAGRLRECSRRTFFNCGFIAGEVAVPLPMILRCPFHPTTGGGD